MGYEIIHIESHCRKCGRCAEVCSNGAIMIPPEGNLMIDRKRCTYCAKCIEICPHQALELAGKYMTVPELFDEIEKDQPFFRRSNGGITMGGGEATMQHEFVAEFLKKCKQHYIHTAMETCGHIAWEHLEKLLTYLDLIYLDIKHMDSPMHKTLTGVANDFVLDNARKVCSSHPVIFRIPVVPGINDSYENISATAKFAAAMGENLLRIELLPYHQFGAQTYFRLGRKYELSGIEPPEDSHMRRLKILVESFGIKAQIGG